MTDTRPIITAGSAQRESIDLERQGAFLRRLSRGLTRNDFEGDEALQVASLWTISRSRGDEVRSFAWWRTVLVRVFSRERRARSRRRHHESEFAARAAQSSPAASDIAERREIIGVLAAAVMELDPASLDVVWRRYFEGMAPRRIAKLRGETTVAVKSRLRRALERLRERLDRSTDGDRSRWFSILSPLGFAARLTTATRVLLMALKWKMLIGSIAAALLVWFLWNPNDGDDLHRIERSPVDGSPTIAARREPDQVAEEQSSEIRETMGERSTETGRQISGRVVDQEGRPVAGATITAEPWDPMVDNRAVDPDRPDPLRRAARSDVEGLFVIAALPSGPAFDLSAIVEGSGMGAVERVLPNRDDIILVVGGTWELSGRIMGLDGAVVPQATVLFESRWKSRLVRRETRSGDDGRYRFESLPTMPHRETAIAGVASSNSGSEIQVSATILIQAMALGHATQVRVVSGQRIQQSAARVEDEDFYLAREKRVRGIIRDAVSSAPVDGAEVILWSIDSRGFGSGRRAIAQTLSDAAGRYDIGGVPVRTEHIHLWNGIRTQSGTSVCFLDVKSAAYASCMRPVAAGTVGGEIDSIDCDLVSSFEVSGRVVDSSGRGLPGLAVVSWTNGEEPVGAAIVALEPCLRAITDSDGRFRITNPVTSGERDSFVRVGVFVSPHTDVLSPYVDVALPVSSPVVLDDLVASDLTGVASWNCRIVSTEGPPVSGAKVTVGFDSVLTDDDGCFEMPAPRFDENGRPRSYAGFKIEARGFKSISGTLTKELAAKPPPTIRLEPMKGTYLGGCVVDVNGRPVAGARVQLLDGALPLSEADRFDPQRPSQRRGSCAPFATTDYAGRFEFAGIGVPVVHLVVRHPDDRDRADLPPDAVLSAILAEGIDHVLTLPFAQQSTWTSVFVHVRSHRDGAPLRAGVGATLLRDGAYISGAEACGPGLVCFEGLAPGRYEIVGTAEDHLPSEPVTIDVQGERRLDVDVTLELGGVIFGTVSAPDGRPLEGRVEVRARRDLGDRSETCIVTASSSGSYRHTGLEWGRWTLEATSHPELHRAAASTPEASLSAGSPHAELNLVMVEGGALTIKLRTRELREQGAATFGSTTPQMNERARDLARKYTIRIERSDGSLAFEGFPDAGGVLDRQSPVLQKLLPSGTYRVIIREGDRELHRSDTPVPATIEVDIEQ